MKKAIDKLIYFSTFSLILLGILIANTYSPAKATALSGNEFNAGRIIDDFIFYSEQPTMSADEIQRFLSSKVPNCDSFGTKIYSGTVTRAQYSSSNGVSVPFTCLKDYNEDTPVRPGESGLCKGFNGGPLSAALIIHRVAESCGINARVLITMLQKEQSLITDDWPWPIQYRSAMGYGCPDTAPCDSQYYGFFNQVYQAARQFKRYALSPQLFNYAKGRTSNVQYQANAPQCGGSSITMQTAATAALYNYTPYQPNAAALNNLYGSGDSCSAYGNRNFWRIFNDWFGTTYSNDTNSSHPSGTLVAGNNKVYLIENNTKRHIFTPSVFQSYNYSWDRVYPASSGDLALPDGIPLNQPAPGTIFYSDNSPVYIMDFENGYLKKRHISSSSFNLLGYKWSEVMYLPPQEVPADSINSILNNDLHPSGTNIVNAAEGKVYQINNGTLRHIYGGVAPSTNNIDWSKVKNATVSDMQLPLGPPLDIASGTILNSGGLFVVNYDDQGIFLQPLGPWECYADRLRYSSKDWYSVSATMLPKRIKGLFTC
jgi:hypothetical protein